MRTVDLIFQAGGHPKTTIEFYFPAETGVSGPGERCGGEPAVDTVSHPSSVKAVICRSLQPVPVRLFLFIIIASYIFSYELKLLHSTHDTSSNYPTAIHNHLYDVIDDFRVATSIFSMENYRIK